MGEGADDDVGSGKEAEEEDIAEILRKLVGWVSVGKDAGEGEFRHVRFLCSSSFLYVFDPLILDLSWA